MGNADLNELGTVGRVTERAVESHSDYTGVHGYPFDSGAGEVLLEQPYDATTMSLPLVRGADGHLPYLCFHGRQWDDDHTGDERAGLVKQSKVGLQLFRAEVLVKEVQAERSAENLITEPALLVIFFRAEIDLPESHFG